MNPIKRYIKEEDVITFKKDGILRLSNIWRFRSLEQPLLDEAEGIRRLKSARGEYVELSPEEVERFFENSNISITGGYIKSWGNTDMSVSFPNAIALCTAAGDHEILKDRFKMENYFIITDTKKFGDAILTFLQKQGFNIIAYCYDWIDYVKSKNYRDTKADFIKETNIFFPPSPSRKIINVTQFPISKFFGNYFTKEKDPFYVEKEYRFVFLCEEEIQKNQSIIAILNPNIIKECIIFR